MQHLYAGLPRDEAPLLADLYQLTMARGHWRAGRLDAQGTFHLTFRRAPFGGTWALAAGVSRAVALLDGMRFDGGDLRWLAGLPGPNGEGTLFEPEFIRLLGEAPLTLDVDAVPDGTVVLPHVPIVTVTGPLWQAQLVETLLLDVIGFETLVATKAARIVRAANGGPVLEFGARRAQGPDASVTAARGAWIGGVAGTSNVLAAKLLDIPVKGTHAHSWVQSFAGGGARELDAFRAFADSMPDGCVLLVDTYDTQRGVENAIQVARELRDRGHELAGIRLDSGDLAIEARAARAALDAAGFPGVKIVASDDLDERRIAALLADEAPIDVWGVGTRLVTGGDQSSLGVVYKLAAVREDGGEKTPWDPVMKLSSEPAKRSLPGRVRVTRVREAGVLSGDLLHLGDAAPSGPYEGVPHPGDEPPSTLRGTGGSLLQPAIRSGRRHDDFPLELRAARERARRELDALPKGAFDVERPTALPVLLSKKLANQRDELVASHLAGSQGESQR